MHVAHRICGLMRRPFRIEERGVTLTTSRGIAIHPDDGQDGATVLRHADTTMHHATGSGRDGARLFSPPLTWEILRRMDADANLRLALDHSVSYLVYQPQVDARTADMILSAIRKMTSHYQGASMKTMAVALALSLSACALIPPVDVPPMSGKQSQAVVFDIDGTLTPRDVDVFEPRPSAAQAVNAFKTKGYAIVYITTRVPLFQAELPNWLKQNGFPPGTLHVAQTADERARPDQYKAGILARYVNAGWKLAYAYGDSTTDFEAYAKVGIPKERVYALKRRGESDCQQGAYALCLDGWAQHLPFIASDVAELR
jgi:acid phosphatase class B